MQLSQSFEQPVIGTLIQQPAERRSIRVLSDVEMDEVAGAVGVPGAVAGAVYGAVSYGIGAAFSGSGSLGGFATAVAGGALVGATGGALSAGAAIWGFNATVAASTANGVASNW
ncbi:hypothetical protein [Massilia sp. DD77]|uniref:hypothetical protein n=1 Tax=Massilia sp. DD77 TaxID=3109349 RepID=UPI002FFF5EA5